MLVEQAMLRATRIRVVVTVFFALFYVGYGLAHYILNDRYDAPILMYVLLASTLGSAADISTRIQNIPDNRRTMELIVDLAWKILGSGILAVFAYAVFASGIVQGALFPSFRYGDGSYVGMQKFMTDVVPAENVDTAKVIVWSFVAGYSQQFITALMTGLDQKAKSEAANKT